MKRAKPKAHWYLRGHCAVGVGVTINGRVPVNTGHPMREYTIGPVERYAQYEAAVCVSWRQPGDRKKRYYIHVVPENLTYYTIHDPLGNQAWDSRSLVPCDMAVYDATVKRFSMGDDEIDDCLARLADHTA